MITYKRLKEVLHYNPDTGIFTRIDQNFGSIKIGQEAGWIDVKGYKNIKIDTKTFFAHRLAFLYMEGYWPENQVDHTNRVRDDNRWCNLREASRSCNMKNKDIQTNNTSGVTGVSKQGNSWIARVNYKNKRIYIGNFKSFDDAVIARWKAEQRYDYKCKTTSSAYKYLKNNNLL